MAAGNVMVSLPQMIDLALHAPEGGTVNFNMLHTLLQIIVQQLELSECNIEFGGTDGDRVQNLISITDKTPPITITEYVVTPAKDAGKMVKRKRGKKPDKPSKKVSKESTGAGVINIDQVTSDESLETVLVVDTAKDEVPYSPVLVSKENMDNLRKELDKVKEAVKELVELPANSSLLEAIRTSGFEKATPVLDMFQMTNLSKRMDAAEVGLEKTGSLLEDLAKEQGNLVFDTGIEVPPGCIVTDRLNSIKSMSELSTFIAKILQDKVLVMSTDKTIVMDYDPYRFGDEEPRKLNLQEYLKFTEDRLKHIEDCLAAGGDFQPLTLIESLTDEPKIPDGTSPRVSKGGKGTSDTSAAGRPRAPSGSGARPSVPGGPTKVTPVAIPTSPQVDLGETNLKGLNLEDLVKGVEEEIKKIKNHMKILYDRTQRRSQSTRRSGAGTDASDSSDGNLSPEDRLTDLEYRFVEYSQQITSLDSTFNTELANMQHHFADMEKELGAVMERVKLGLPAGDTGLSGESVGELYEKMMALQSDIDTLADTAAKLVEDKEDKQKYMDALLEQIDLLKTIKADKEDLEDALADKADACAINRKVSHDQFDTACDELSRGIEEALAKLTQQETMWQQALEEIQREIDNKLDRMELGPLREFVNNKLKMLQQRLKALTALKKETEAAGTKKFLRNVNCISCDKDVVMRKEMDASLLPQPYSLPPTRSMGPYLAYELDALRKQQKTLGTSRNLHHFETALNAKSPRGDDHMCNRYCGGSHTVTTPQQRVTRLGHFLNQWGPEAQPAGEGTGKLKEKDDAVLSAIVVQGDALTPRTSKAAVERESSKRISAVQTQEKKASTVSIERRGSKGGQSKAGLPTSPKTSGELLEKKSQTSPKGSAEGLEKKASSGVATPTPTPRASGENFERRQSGISAGSQKGSQTSAKRASQVSVKSVGAVAAVIEKPSSRISFNIPEETPSEVAEAEQSFPPPPSESDQPETSVEAPSGDAPSQFGE